MRSEPVGNTVVIVKLFRVFLLLPVVLGVGWYFTRKGTRHGEACAGAGLRHRLLLRCLPNSAIAIGSGLDAGLRTG